MINLMARLFLSKEARELSQLLNGRKVKVSITSNGYCISEE